MTWLHLRRSRKIPQSLTIIHDKCNGPKFTSDHISIDVTTFLTATYDVILKRILKKEGEEEH